MSLNYYSLENLIFYDRNSLNILRANGTDYDIFVFGVKDENTYYLSQKTNAEKFLNWYNKQNETIKKIENYMHKTVRVNTVTYAVTDTVKNSVINKFCNMPIYFLTEIISKEEYKISYGDFEKLLSEQ